LENLIYVDMICYSVPCAPLQVKVDTDSDSDT